MANTEILSIYIKKLSHPLKEIRERALQLLSAKLKLGWELDDELAGTRQLLEALLAWFYAPEPTLQREAFELLLTTIKTKTGTYIVREFGISTILSNLKNARHKIAQSALELYDDVIDTLRFINTVESDCNVAIPRLSIPNVTSSESDGGSSSSYYNLGPNVHSSKETSISNDSEDNRHTLASNTGDGIRILLFPWVNLCQSDKKTLLLVEDALKLLKSTRRCCRFIRDVFLRDFPPEIFLNRPDIVKSLLRISDGSHGGRPGEALFVLLYITRALRMRILQLSTLDFVHESNKISGEHKEIDDGTHLELQEIAGANHLPTPQEEDGLVTLKQLPAPVYALDTMHAILSIMARSVVLVDPVNETELLEMKDLNTCLCLVDSLVGLLLDCIQPNFWNMDHSTKTYRDISHKSCMTMRLLGDLLFKYRQSFFNDTDRCHHRVAWLRLVICADKLLSWARDSALPPTSLISAMQQAQLDPAIQLFYPKLNESIDAILQNTRTSVNQDYKSKYKALKKLFENMNEAVYFIKNKKSQDPKAMFTCMKKSLSVLELFQNENFLLDISEILLKKTKDMDMNDSEWSSARSIALSLMAHNLEWVQKTFYQLMADMVKSILVGDENYPADNEKCLTLLCDVGILTEICCHGLTSNVKEVEESASDIMLYLLRGRLVLSESCWWRLLASLLPVLPLLHVHAAHETQLGKAICKSLERDIADCMGVAMAEVTMGLVRLLFVKCVAVQLDAAHTLCQWLDDDRYLPPKESLRPDILLSALRRVQPQEFNIDFSSSPSKVLQTGGLLQIMDVLKQDIMLDENGEFVARRTTQPTLEPSLRRSTLQQLAVIMRQQELQHTFLQNDGVRVIVATLRMSLMVDDYLAFPECAISCVSVLNSVCFGSRHTLSKIADLPALLIRVILIFPANDSSVLMASQILALISWAGFALQELDTCRHRVPALPLSVTNRTTLPFNVRSYWNTSPNAEHSYIEWLLAEEEWRTAIRVRWWCAQAGTTKLLAATPPAAPLALSVTSRDLATLRAACPLYSCTKALLALQNSTTHKQVNEALHILESYVYLVPSTNISKKDFGSLPWQHTKRFLCSPPASSRDAILLCSLLHFIIAYMDNVPNMDGTMLWIKSSFIGNEANIIALLSREEFYPQQTIQDSIEVTQLHIHIVKVLLRCISIVDRDGDYDSCRLESLVKILLACLDKIDLKNFHLLGYLNELMRCIRYALNSRYCKLSEDTLILCLKVVVKTVSICTSSGGCKGQACRLDAFLSLLALLKQIQEEAIPVQRWNELFNSDAVSAVVKSASGERAELRSAAVHVIVALAYYAQMHPHLLQAIQESSLSEFALQILSNRGEANVVRAAAASLLTSIASRASSRSHVLEANVLDQLNENHFIENCLEILIEFCNVKEYKHSFQPNVSLSLLERRNELEVRAQKNVDVSVSTLDSSSSPPPPTVGLVTSLADALYNISAFPKCPVQQWNEQGLYRLLFRCTSWSCDVDSDTHAIRAASCRALLAVTSHKCVRLSLATTKDCLHNLLMTLTPFGEDDMNGKCLRSRAVALSLLASLLVERSAIDSVWRYLKEDLTITMNLLHLILQCLESDELELQDAALYCLTQLAQSMSQKKHVDNTKDKSCSELYDSLKSPFWEVALKERGAGDSARSRDCQPEYLAEELCKALINLYQKSIENKDCDLSQDERWVSVSSCLSSVLAVSGRSRRYAVHRRLSRLLLVILQMVRDRLTMEGKSADVIRNSNNNPVLCTLYWVLTVIDCSMVDCAVAKETYADENIVLYLCRLWCWCMMTEQLRNAVVHLLYTFTNDCPKAWGGLSACVGGRTLAGELCALVSREAHGARARPAPALLLALRALRRAAKHHHARAILLKSEAIESVYRLCMRTRVRGVARAGAALDAWARLCEAAARHADGAGALLSVRGGGGGGGQLALATLPPHARALLLPALAHAAHHHRQTFLQSAELLDLLCDTLLGGDTAEVVSASRAVWALAANNHKVSTCNGLACVVIRQLVIQDKAKLALRSAGVASAIQNTLQRLRRISSDSGAQKAIQLLMYTNTVLQTA